MTWIETLSRWGDQTATSATHLFLGGPFDDTERANRNRTNPTSICRRIGAGPWHHYRHAGGHTYRYTGRCDTIPEGEHGPGHGATTCQ